MDAGCRSAIEGALDFKAAFPIRGKYDPPFYVHQSDTAMTRAFDLWIVPKGFDDVARRHALSVVMDGKEDFRFCRADGDADLPALFPFAKAMGDGILYEGLEEKSWRLDIEGLVLDVDGETIAIAKTSLDEAYVAARAFDFLAHAHHAEGRLERIAYEGGEVFKEFARPVGLFRPGDAHAGREGVVKKMWVDLALEGHEFSVLEPVLHVEDDHPLRDEVFFDLGLGLEFVEGLADILAHG